MPLFRTALALCCVPAFLLMAFQNTATPAKLSSFDPQVRKLLATMSLDEKIGQMTQPDQMYLKSLDDIETYHLGSLLSGGDSDPKSGNDLKSWTDLYDRYQARALASKRRIPLLYGIDAVHGNNNVLGATVFPQNIGLGCTRNPELVEKIGRITAEEVRATGINWAFAPCVAVPQDIRWGRTYEGFSESPEIVKTLGEAGSARLAMGRPAESASGSCLRQALRRGRRHLVEHRPAQTRRHALPSRSGRYPRG